MNLEKFRKQYGPWTVVTGASSGIGYEFAQQLAAMGLNLILVARRQEALEKLAIALQNEHQIDTRVISVDLTSDNFLDSISETTNDLDVGLLVSNAGFDQMGAFLRVPIEGIKSGIKINVVAHAELAHHFSNQMLKRGGHGGVLLVSSLAGLQGTPYAGNYAGAKAYVLNLGEALNYELRKTNINVSVLMPGPTSTPGFHENPDIDFSQMPVPPMNVEPVVKGAIKALTKNKPFYIPGFMNRIMAGFLGRRIMSRAGNVAMWGFLMGRAAPDNLKVGGKSKTA